MTPIHCNLMVPLCVSAVFQAEPEIQPFSCLLLETSGRLLFRHHYEIGRRSDGSFVWTMIDAEYGPVWRFLLNRQPRFSGYVIPHVQRWPFTLVSQLPKVRDELNGNVLHTIHSTKPCQETWLDVEHKIYLRETMETVLGELDWRIDSLVLVEPSLADFEVPQL